MIPTRLARPGLPLPQVPSTPSQRIVAASESSWESHPHLYANEAHQRSTGLIKHHRPALLLSAPDTEAEVEITTSDQISCPWAASASPPPGFRNHLQELIMFISQGIRDLESD